jgi:hypothetical protein
MSVQASGALVMGSGPLCSSALGAPSKAPFDTAKIEALTGAKGTLNEKEGVFKVSVPRSGLRSRLPASSSRRQWA